MLTIEIRKKARFRYIWWKTIGNVYHKYHGPARCNWYQNGLKYVKEHIVNGKPYRAPGEGSAYTVWSITGKKMMGY